MARDSKGNLYAGGGTGAKLFRIAPDGKGKLLADLDALEIHAIAVDSRDRVYAATSPDGKVYRIAGNGKPEVFYDPKAKYIWGMVFDAAGNLYVATGDQGELHRVTPDGKGEVFFKSEETHVRSLAVDAKGNLIVGNGAGRTGAARVAGGRGLRAVSNGEARSNGGGGGARRRDLCGGGGQPADGPAPPTAATGSGAPCAGGNSGADRRDRDGPASAGRRGRAATARWPGGVAGGSEVYRIEPDGEPRKVWSHRAGRGVRDRVRRAAGTRCWGRETRATCTGSNRRRCTRRCWRCRRRR